MVYINLKNEIVLKDLESHNTEIKFLIHSIELNLIATCSIDNVIKIYDDHELLESDVIKELKIPDFDVRALCLINRFSRLGIGLSNGVVKFYDIEHFHFDSDLETNSSNFTDEVSCLDQVEEIELVLYCYSSGLCKFIVTSPSTAKFNTIYQFNNSEKGKPTSIACLEFNNNLHHVFIRDNSHEIANLMQEYTPSRGVRPFGCCIFQNLQRRYKDGLSIDDGLGIIISTLREGYDGEITEKNIEIATI